MTYRIMNEVDAKAIILVLLKNEGALKAKQIRKRTGFKKDFVYYRLDEFTADGWIESFKKIRIRGRFFRITEKGLKELQRNGED